MTDTNNKTKILLLEDSYDLIEFYFNKLVDAGFSVTVESDEHKGLKVASSSNPDLIIFDISLPYNEDFWFIKELKSDSRTVSIPVVVLTDLSSDEDIKSGLASGASEYLVRENLSFSEVIDRIKEVLNKNRK
jgi:DNA-binding response OmpR family regulator